MNNLIVTIIAIGLAASVAATAIFYGGQAYQQYTVNMAASQTIHTMNLIKSAVNAWQQDNPGLTFPTTDPVTSTTYTSSNATAWGDTLTYTGRQYLALPFYSSYSSFNINYGTHGSLTDWANAPGASSGTAHFGSATLQIVADSSGNLWLVWYLNMGSTSGQGSTGKLDVLFYGQVCYAINQQMGQIPYASSLTVNTNYYTVAAPSIQINLPAYTPTTTYLSKVCETTATNGSVQYYYFAMPL